MVPAPSRGSYPSRAQDATRYRCVMLARPVAAQRTATRPTLVGSPMPRLVAEAGEASTTEAVVPAAAQTLWLVGRQRSQVD